MSDEKETDSGKVNEPDATYIRREIRVFNSFEEQEAYEMEKMAALTSVEILEQMQQFITIAYGMHGYDPDNLPSKHSIQIIKKG